jgi:glycosyltransferase involved in cell wall biosynthesis
LKSNFDSDGLVWLVVDPLGGHRISWAVELGILAKKMNISLGIVAILEPSFDASNDFEMKAKQYFQSVEFVENELQLKDLIRSRRSEKKQTLFLFFDLEKHVFWLLRNRIRFRGIFMRPYLEGFNFRSVLAWIIKRSITTVSQLIPHADIKLLSIPLQRSNKPKKDWVRDELTLNKVISHVSRHVPENLEKYRNLVVVPGFLDTRKDLNLALLCINRLRSLTNDDISLLFAGKAARNFVHSYSKVDLSHVTLEDRYLSDREYTNLIFSSRIVLLPYSNRGASGIVIEALILGTPIVIVGRRTWSNVSRLSGGLIQFSSANPKFIAGAALKAEIHKSTNIRELLSEEDLMGISEFFLNP